MRRRLATVIVTLLGLWLSAAGWDAAIGDDDAPRASVPAAVPVR